MRLRHTVQLNMGHHVRNTPTRTEGRRTAPNQRKQSALRKGAKTKKRTLEPILERVCTRRGEHDVRWYIVFRPPNHHKMQEPTAGGLNAHDDG